MQFSTILHHFLRTTFFIGIATYLFYNIFINHALAQISDMQNIPTPKTYGAWTKICSLPPGTPNIQCEIVQDIRTQDRRDITFRVAFFKLPKNQGTLMRVFVPIRVELRPGVGLKIDNKDMEKIEYRRCLGDVCIAESLMKKETLRPFLEGKIATYFIFTTPEQGVGGVLDLNGFRDAYDALSK
ncbi:invasion associated locus B family protein [Bartonella sp. F02]|uniref:invasion associated locus B family protein n=1 Tax=Bartonella sp. F02 TaxID=2967262 RepID=UPI0022A9DC8B|nr:invasion associated locus B family protein [Bartonella sp. F02]MCZ2328474.1 invasion associated locus B family protein [Bartonella sp. F02]